MLHAPAATNLVAVARAWKVLGCTTDADGSSIFHPQSEPMIAWLGARDFSICIAHGSGLVKTQAS